MKWNLYVDGSWLFKQCDKNRIFANRTESPGRAVALDFVRLASLIEARARMFYGGSPERGVAYLCTSIFAIPADVETWPAAVRDPAPLAALNSNIHARGQFADSAVAAGFSPDGLLRPPLRPWVLDAWAEGRYQEKQVDTWLVAHLVERAITDPESVHFIVSGDADMMPGIETVVPRYTERVIHVGTHPLQYDQSEQQTSYAFEGSGLKFGPVYLEDNLEQILAGPYVGRCRNPGCGKIFIRGTAPRGPTAGFCYTCEAQVSSRFARRRP